MASALAFLVLPTNFAAAEEVETEELVLPSESNEGELKYGELVDYFVTAERIPSHRMDTPANVTVITAAEIEANHYQDLAEALSHVNGAVVTGTNSLTLNGNRHVLLLVDGIRLNVNQAMFAADNISKLSAIPSMKMIERIEIVKGGSSALYGTDAAGGVINIITKKGTKHETTLDMNFGSWNKQNYELTNQGTAGKFSWFLTGGFHKSNDYKYNGGVDDSSDYKESAFSLRLDNQFDENNSLTFNVLYKNTKEDDGYSKEKHRTLYLSYNFKESTNTPGWLRYFNNYHGEYDYGVEHIRSLTREYGMDYNYYGSGTAKLQGVEYQNGWELGKHKLIVGAEWHKGKANNFAFFPSLNIIGATVDEPKDMKNTSFYLQDTISFDDKWIFVPGIRYDHNSEFGHQWSPKASVNYRADDKTKIYASWGKVFRAPTIAEWYSAGINPAQTFAILGGRYSEITYGESFRPEKGHSEVIGFEHDFNKNTNLNVSFFNTKMDNVILWYTEYNLNADVLFARNSNDTQEQRGIAISFQQKVNDNWSYDLGYTHTHTNLGAYPMHSQPNGYRVGVHYLNGPFKANLLGIMSSGIPTVGNGGVKLATSGSYVVLDFNTSYDINENATIYARALNFTNKNWAYQNAINHNPGRFFQIGAQFKF